MGRELAGAGGPGRLPAAGLLGRRRRRCRAGGGHRGVGIASVATPRFFAVLAATFAAIGLFLAAAGLYGVLSYSVVSQRRALGVRRALGAQTGDILRLVLGRGAVLVLAGLVLGLLGSWWAAGLLAGLLTGLPGQHPAVYAVAALIVCAVAFVACYLPARRATRIEPLSVLRAE